MRYATRVESAAEVFGAEETGNFSILANGKAFSVLIDGLYADKIWSICREACANAFDGHIKAGNTDRPFLVHAPTRWEPFFYVRDRGCSMSHEFVMRNYTQLFFSSKDESDEESGCFGLGCKSPFAYTTNFTVTCWKDGEQRDYTAYIDADDMPRIVLNQRGPTTEETGVMVQMAVKEQDFYAFTRAIERAALGYDVQFECSGVNLPKLEYRQRHGSYDVVEDWHNHAHGPACRIGPVIYPIDTENESARRAFEQRNPNILRLLRDAGDVLLNVPIGGGQVTPSRESLSYKPAMIDALGDLLNAICNDSESRIATFFTGCSTKWDYALALRKAQADQTLSKFERELLPEFLTPWGSVNSLLECNIPYLTGHCAGGVRKFLGERFSRSDSDRTMMRDAQSALVIYDPTKNGAVANITGRLDLLMKREGYRRIYFVRLYDPKVALANVRHAMPKNATRLERKSRLRGVYENFKDTRKRLDDMIAEFECPNVYDLNQLEKPPAKYREVPPPQIYTCTGNNVWTTRDINRIADNETVLVFPLKLRRVEGSIKNFPSSGELVAAFAAAGMKFHHVVGVAESNRAALHRLRPDWVFVTKLKPPPGALDQFLKVGDTLKFIEWADRTVAVANERFRVSEALKFCPAHVSATFDPYFKLTADILARLKTGREWLKELAKSGVLSQRAATITPEAAAVVLKLLGATRGFEDHTPDQFQAGKQAILAKYPEIESVGLKGESPVLLASYLLGRELIMLPLAEMKEAA